MTTIPSLATWGPTGTITATTVNNHFSTIRTYVNTYFAQIDATNTWTASQTFGALTATTVQASGLVTAQAGVTVTGTITMSTAASKVVPGATSLTFRNNADSADNLSISNAGIVGVRAGLGISAGTLQMDETASRLVAGATSFSIRNNANGADNLILTDAGAATIRAGLTVTAGGLTVSAGTTAVGAITSSSNLTFSAASAKIIPGATSLLFRNTADSATNLTITDAGVVTGLQPRCSLSRNASENVTTGSTVTWTVEVTDPQAMHAANSDTITVPVAGVYLVQVMLRSGDNWDTGGQVSVLKSGTVSLSGWAMNAAADVVIISGLLHCSASDTITVRNDCAGTLDVGYDGVGLNTYPRIDVVKLW